MIKRIIYYKRYRNRLVLLLSPLDLLDECLILPHVPPTNASHRKDIDQRPAHLPHSIDMEASETLMSVYINPKGIDWNGKTVYLVIVLCFSSSKRESFHPVFRVLTDSLVNTQSINSLINVSSYHEFIQELELLF